MDKINCSLIKDLLPLYIDDVISEESRIFIKNHLDECKECKNEFERLTDNSNFPAIMNNGNSDMENIINFKNKIRKDKRISVLIAILIIMIFIITNFAHLTKRDYIDYPYSNMDITTSSEGIVTLSFLGAYELYEIEEDVYYLSLYTSDFLYFAKDIKYQSITVNPNGEGIKTIYYVSNSGRENQVIYGKDLDGEYSGSVILQRMVLNYYFTTAIAGTIILCIATLIFKKNKNLKNIISILALLPFSYIIGHILIMGWNSASYQTSVDFIFIIILTVFIYSLLLILINKYKIKKI